MQEDFVPYETFVKNILDHRKQINQDASLLHQAMAQTIVDYESGKLQAISDEIKLKANACPLSDENRCVYIMTRGPAWGTRCMKEKTVGKKSHNCSCKKR